MSGAAGVQHDGVVEAEAWAHAGVVHRPAVDAVAADAVREVGGRRPGQPDPVAVEHLDVEARPACR